MSKSEKDYIDYEGVRMFELTRTLRTKADKAWGAIELTRLETLGVNCVIVDNKIYRDCDCEQFYGV